MCKIIGLFHIMFHNSRLGNLHANLGDYVRLSFVMAKWNLDEYIGVTLCHFHNDRCG